MVNLAPSVQSLAAEGIFIGTSSWKYPGWLGQIYSEERYNTRGKFSEAKFNRECLAEYAETFSTVCVDAAFYTFPKVDGLTELAGAVQSQFRFAFKVTDEITVKRFPKLPRFGPRGGTDNASWHKSGALRWHHFEPVYLPAYSPDFNPIERLWLRLKADWFTDYIAKSGAELTERICTALNAFIDDPARVASNTALRK